MCVCKYANTHIQPNTNICKHTHSPIFDQIKPLILPFNCLLFMYVPGKCVNIYINNNKSLFQTQSP